MTKKKHILEALSLLLLSSATIHLFTVSEQNIAQTLMVIVLVLVSFLVLFFVRDTQTSSKYPIPWSTVPLSLMVVFVYIETIFGFFSFNALVHHISYEITTNVDSDLIEKGYQYGFATIAILLIIYWLKRDSKKYQVFDKLFALVLLIGNPMNIQAVEYFYSSSFEPSKRSELSDFFAQPNFEKTTPELKNLIFIYLESYERTYFDERQFGNISEELKKLSKSALDFTNIDQIKHTEWTMAGMIASQCGTPLFPYGLLNRNKFDKTDAFMAKTICMSDVLNHSGYHTAYIGGDSIRFSGKENYLKSHSFTEFYGKKKLNNTIKPSELSAWGIHDEDVFSFASNKVKSYFKDNKPFAIFISSLDTHNPKGMPNSNCRKKFGNQYSQEMMLSLKCTDSLIYDFILDIKSDSNYRDSVFVIVSDHLAMKNPLIQKLESSELGRKNLFLIIGDDLEAKKINKKGSLIDVYPTVMETLGFRLENPKANLGVSLLNNHPTLIEIYNKNVLNQLVENEHSVQRLLW